MSPVRIGVMGCGRIGRMHAELIAHQVPGAEVAAVYDVVDEASASVAEDLGVRQATDAAEVLEADDVDAVAICTSTHTHIDLLVATAEAGKAAFVEKPLALNLADVDRGIAAAEAAGIPVQVGFNRRFDPSHRYVRDRVAAGDLGDVHLVRISSRDPEPPPLMYLDESGGIFCDMTIHDFDMIRFVTNSEVTEVYATGAVLVDEAIGEVGDLDTAVVVCHHESGAISTIDNSRRAVYGYDQRVEAFGSAGMAASENPLTATAVTRTADGARGPALPYFFLERYVPSYLAEWDAFVAMMQGEPSPVTLADGRAPLAIGLAAWRSVRERRPVQIDEIG
ncbi:inositol 2-dehydrogenase [Candidatus Poriferisocius sp.]|uniref:inositol 2-dehydrogenase n=1 Tax=Candidatus Poriferisocius sp. TaxID=3101276 RepID=UPI003B02C288